MYRESPSEVLSQVREMGVEEMWEDHADHALSGIKSLAARLGAEREVPYPSGAGYCDIVLGRPEQRESWLELKFAWTYTTDRNPSVRNGNYRKHLFTNTSYDVTHKLNSLIGRPRVARIGLLLVTFYTPRRPCPCQRRTSASSKVWPVWAYPRGSATRNGSGLTRATSNVEFEPCSGSGRRWRMRHIRNWEVFKSVHTDSSSLAW